MSEQEQQPEGPDDLDLSEVELEDALLDRSGDEDADDRLIPGEAPDE